MSAIFSTSESEYVYIGIGVEAGLEKFETFSQTPHSGHIRTLQHKDSGLPISG